MADASLDCKGLSCPMPIVNISKQMKKLEAGATLEVEASDPAFRADVQAWAAKTGNELIEFTEGAVQVAILRKGG